MSAAVPETGSAAAIRAVLDALLAAKRVVVTGHVKPDADALGAALALAGYLRNAGRDAIVMGIEPLPEGIQFLMEGQTPILSSRRYHRKPGDLLCLVDASSEDRMQMSLRPLFGRVPMAIVDHHWPKGGYPEGAAVYAIPDASSTCELVWNLAQTAGWPLTHPIAEALWTGIITDTNRFAYSSSRPSTLRCAADLLEKGAVRTALIADESYNLVSERRLRLQDRLIRSIRLLCGGRLSIGFLLPEDYAAEGASLADSSNFVDVPRFIRGVEVAAFVYPVRNGDATCVSLRSASEAYNVAELCARWGGGGHIQAAGATIPRPIAEALPDVTATLEAFLGERTEPSSPK